jgi:SAM-dependent methyltransferase
VAGNPIAEETEKAAFSEKMVAILNGGALNLAMAIGYRTGLFDVLASWEHPQTAAAIAASAGLHHRYVREWLSVMATGGIVELTASDRGGSLYRLPAAHAAFLTRASGNRNLAVYTQEIPLLTACALDPVIAGFKSGDGIPYDRYPEFQAFMTELSDAKHRDVLVDRFLPSVDDGRLVARLQQGMRVCDLGCGEGLAARLMARAYPRSRFVGLDISPTAIESARQAAASEGLDNITFEVRDAARLCEDETLRGTCDYLLAFDAIHDQTRPLEALRGAHHLLAPGGVFSMIDIAAETEPAQNLEHPMGPFLYTVSLMHCMPVGRLDGGRGLGMMWGREQAVEMLSAAGFSDVKVSACPEDPFNDHFECRKR